ncbi:MAG: hypothetical protein ACFB0B_03245 [Thermonemataceae bacterium]
MKLYLLLILQISLLSHSQAQRYYQFKARSMYGTATINRLKPMVDAANKRYQAVANKAVYQTYPQASGHYLEMEVKDTQLKSFIGFMEEGRPFEDFVATFSPDSVEKNLIVLKSRYARKSYRHIPQQDSTSGGWYYRLENGETNLHAFFLEKPLQTKPLPPKYQQILSYAAQMIGPKKVFYDSVSIIDRGRTYPAYDHLMRSLEGRLGKAELYLEMSTNNEVYSQKKDTIYQFVKPAEWYERAIKVIKKDKVFQTLLSNAINEAKKKNSSNFVLELFTEHCVSPEAALDLKRRRLPRVGRCLSERTTYQHLIDVARLASEIAHPQICIPANISAMYHEEQLVLLVALGIDIAKLNAGMMLHTITSNPSVNHHVIGTFNKKFIGSAMLKTGFRYKIEAYLLAAIRDTTLDKASRLNASEAYHYHFITYDKSEQRRKSSETKWQQARKTIAGNTSYLYVDIH